MIHSFVSIIIPSLNRCAFLKNAILSVLSQDYPFIELIVVDGASIDGTIDLLRSYGKKIKWISEKDKSLTEAINKGVKIASGKYFMTLATDEILMPGSISLLVKVLEDSKADIAIGQGFYINEKQEIIGVIDNPKNILFEDVLTLRYKLPLAFSFFSMSFFKKNLFDENFVVCQDFMFWLTVFEKSKIIFINNRIGKFTKHDGSWSWNVKAGNKILKARFLAYKKYFSQNKHYAHYKKKAYIAAYLDFFELLLPLHFFRAYSMVVKSMLLSFSVTRELIQERGYEGRIFRMINKITSWI